MKITNYDVLIDGGCEGSFKLVDQEHVGNNRFEVFLNLHKEEYAKEQAAGNQQGMDIIVEKIVDIVCHRCVPNGRFLEKAAIPIEGEDDWMELGEGELARRRLHQALQGGKEPTPRNSKMLSQTTQAERKVDEFASKRRRRGSYARLRRSISESMLFHSTLEKKNQVNMFNSVFLAAAELGEEHASIQTPNPMDVVFTPSRNGLTATGMPGNARFGILISMNAESFLAAGDKRPILAELMKTVENHWKGRFLVTSLDGYEELPREAVSATISKLLMNEGKMAAVADPAPLPVSVPSQMAMAPTASMSASRSLMSQVSDLSRASDRSISSSYAKPPLLETAMSDYSAGSTGLTRGFTNMSFNTSQSSLGSIPQIDDPEANNLRKTAVEALKAKKAKRDLMKRVMGRKNSDM